MRTQERIQGRELAVICAKAAEEIKAEEIRVWDLRGLSSLTDFMVVCSGSSMPHLKAIMRDVRGHVKEWARELPVYAEGNTESRWMVLDYIDVMVHIMHAETREFYKIEQLWGDAKPVAWAEGACVAGETDGQRSAEALS